EAEGLTAKFIEHLISPPMRMFIAAQCRVFLQTPGGRGLFRTEEASTGPLVITSNRFPKFVSHDDDPRYEFRKPKGTSKLLISYRFRSEVPYAIKKRPRLGTSDRR